MKFRKTAALLAGLLLCAGTLGGCALRQAEEVTAESTVSLRNDGHEVKLVLAQIDNGGERAAVLREIADKYEADFPNTEVEIRSFDSREALDEAWEAGEQLDLVELDTDTLLPAVERDKLLDLYSYLKAWDESATLTLEARQAAGALGAEHAYLLPFDFSQQLMFYRADWFGEFNEGKKETEMAWCRSWDQILKASGMLGERGKLALAGRDRLVDTFDAAVWSTVGLGRVADPAAAYFAAKDEGTTVFSLELAADGAAKFQEVMETVALPEAVNWTEEQAVDAFVQGKAGMLLADRKVSAELQERMEAGSWDTEGPPRGQVGAAVFADEFFGWGVSASTKEAEIAVHFLTFLSNADNNTHFAKVCGTLPIHLEAQEMEESLMEGERARELEMIQSGDWYQYASQPVMYRAHEGYRDEANGKLRKLLSGEITREELLKDLDAYWAKAYVDEGNLWK